MKYNRNIPLFLTKSEVFLLDMNMHIPFSMIRHICFILRLLDIIAGRKNPKGLAGLLLLDGSQPPHNFKCMVGYVTQVRLVLQKYTPRQRSHSLNH